MVSPRPLIIARYSGSPAGQPRWGIRSFANCDDNRDLENMAEQIKELPLPGLTTTDKLRMLLDITKKISRSLDLQEVLHLVMDTLDSLIPYDAAGIFVLKGMYQRVGEKTSVFQAE
jgi:hypothetical protein